MTPLRQRFIDDLRLRNYANVDDGGKPFTSKALRECYQQGAAHFGWRPRSLTPGATRFLVQVRSGYNRLPRIRSGRRRGSRATR